MNTTLRDEKRIETAGHVLNWPGFVYDLGSILLSFGKAARIRQALITMAAIKEGARVLDIGCGTGTAAILASRCAGPGGSVSGIDPGPRMIATARRKAKRRGTAVGFRLAAVEAIPYPDRSFDVVLSSFMLHHLPPDVKRRGFAEVRRVLKPEGRFVAVDLQAHGFSLHNFVARLLGGHRGMKADGSPLVPMLQGAGFRDVRTGPTEFRSVYFVEAVA